MALRIVVLTSLMGVLSGLAASVSMGASIPEPPSVNMIPPPNDLAAEIAAFWGIWEGNFWIGARGATVAVPYSADRGKYRWEIFNGSLGLG